MFIKKKDQKSQFRNFYLPGSVNPEGRNLFNNSSNMHAFIFYV